jgi:hypothetical protein
MLLVGNTAAISGAASARRIGLATVRLFAKHGARVAILDLDEAGAQRAAKEVGGGHIGLACDVADLESCKRAAQQAIEAFGHVNILVNNAGITQPLKVMDISPENWRRVSDVNTTGVHGDVRGRALAARALGQPPRPASAQRDQLLHAPRLGRPRVRHRHVRRDGGKDDRPEGGGGVEGQVAAGRRVHRKGCRCVPQQRVAVRPRGGHWLGVQRASGAGAVLDDRRLAQGLLRQLGQGTHLHVGGGAGRPGGTYSRIGCAGNRPWACRRGQRRPGSAARRDTAGVQASAERLPFFISAPADRRRPVSPGERADEWPSA